MLVLGLTLLLLSQISDNLVLEIKADKTKDVYDGYRLPSYQNPSKYKIDINLNKTIFDGESSIFEGTVELTFQVHKAKSIIQLHANSNMIIGDITLAPSDVTIQNKSINKTSSILTLELSGNLKANTDYVLKIPYTGHINLETTYGFFRSSYKNDKNITQYLLATQFEATYARDAFPCFDEPSYKATFIVSIVYPKVLNALSNTPLNGNPIAIGSDYLRATFQETPKMSTYLVAFIISKFTCSKAEDIETGVPNTICSARETVNHRDLAVKYSTNILKALANFTNIKYSAFLTKMTQAALPRFSSQAMENWGLVIYRESMLIWDQEESPNINKQLILGDIAHECTHQWFGNYVTCNWWDNIFLNEGFATYFAAFILAQIPELTNFELDKQFNIDYLQLAFLYDARNASNAITSKVASPSQIQSKFDAINYYKAASVIRMMEHIVTFPNFQAALRNYLKAKAFSNVEVEDLLNALEQQTPRENLPDGITFPKAMSDWLNIPGFPLVTVSNSGNDVILEQKRFFLNNTMKNNATWCIPITYTLETDEEKFTRLIPQEWLITEKKTLSNLLVNTSSWIILNNQQSAFYRVNYNEELWNRIRVALSKNHTDIHVLNRAQIADDVLNLANSDLLKFSKALSILEYLVHETDYYPWKSALTAFEKLLNRVGEQSDLIKPLQEKLLKLLDAAYKTVDFESHNEEEHIYHLKRNLILQAACKFGHSDCISNAVSKFKALRDNGTRFDKNLKSVIYCNGLRYSTDPKIDWNFLWEELQDPNFFSETDLIVTALGCITDVDLLKKYLYYAEHPLPDISYQKFDSAIVSRSPKGIQVMFEFITKEQEKNNAYSSTVASLLYKIALEVRTQEELNKLQEFVTRDNMDKFYKKVGKSVIKYANSYLKWSTSIKDDIVAYLSH